jgi:hypothetical protein
MMLVQPVWDGFSAVFSLFGSDYVRVGKINVDSACSVQIDEI